MKKDKLSFKRMFLAATFGLLPIMILTGILAMFGWDVIQLNNVYVYGVMGFFVSILMAPLAGLSLAFFCWVIFNMGEYLFSLILTLLSPKKRTKDPNEI